MKFPGLLLNCSLHCYLMALVLGSAPTSTPNSTTTTVSTATATRPSSTLATRPAPIRRHHHEEVEVIDELDGGDDLEDVDNEDDGDDYADDDEGDDENNEEDGLGGLRSANPVNDPVAPEVRSGLASVGTGRRRPDRHALRIYRIRTSPLVLVKHYEPWRRYPRLCRSLGLHPAVINRCNFWDGIRLLQAARVNRAWARWDVANFQHGIMAPRHHRRCRLPDRPLIFRQPTSIAQSHLGDRMERWAEAQLRLRAVALCSKHRLPHHGNVHRHWRTEDELASDPLDDYADGEDFDDILEEDEVGDPRPMRKPLRRVFARVQEPCHIRRRRCEPRQLYHRRTRPHC
jgi:hypothetical protein